MPNLKLILVFLMCAAFSYATARSEDQINFEPWTGTWTNTDANTNSTTRLVVTRNEGKLIVHGFGKCHPTDCDWGTTGLHICQVQPNDGPVGFASWDAKFKDHHIVLRLTDEKLVVESFDIYKDQSGRRNRSRTETFAKP